jgi:hypothetical protein
MKSSVPRLVNSARRLLALEDVARKNAGIKPKAPAAFAVCEKLRRTLSRFAGIAGFRSLLSRALTLANDEVPWLRAVHVNEGGSLNGLDEIEFQLSQEDTAQGEAVLIAHLIGLLVTFIGESLTARLIREAWPELGESDLDFGPEKET